MDSIRNRSVTGDELLIQRDFFEPFLQKKMSWSKVDSFSVDGEKERPNINAVWKGSGRGQNLLLNGHVDVVDVPEIQRSRWTKDPWTPLKEGEYIFGRGANDMKGGISSMIWAVKALMENEVNLQGTLALELVVGEERMDHEVGTTAATRRLLDQGYNFSFCVVPEPTDCEIQTVSAGSFDFEVSVAGKEIHTAMRNLILYPQRAGLPSGQIVGVDAVCRLIDILKLFEKLERDWVHRYKHEVLGSGGYPMHEDAQGVGCFTINPSFVEAGSYLASVPGNATATCQVYHPSWVKYEEVVTEIRRVVEAYASTDDWLRLNPPKVTAPRTFVWPPYETDVNHPGCASLAKAWEHAVGRPAQFSGLKAVDDQAFIQALGIPGVSMGPGNIFMGGHGPDERVTIKQLPMMAKTLALFIIDWCGAR
jgi:acetylornithine deacetylase